MPKDTVARIQADLAFVLWLPTVCDKRVAPGMYPIGSTPEEFGTHMRAVSVKFEKVIQAAGIKTD